MTHFCTLDQTDPKAPKPPAPKSNPVIYKPHGLGFRLSYKCLIGCRHCYQKSLPGSDVFMDKDRLLGVLAEGRDVGMQNVGFSGGEPFLCADTVFEGIATARKVGYEGAVGFVTNGFWGKTPQSAKTIIDKLADAGFSPPNGRLNLSVGEFHQEWISFSAVSNVVSAHWEKFQQPVYLLVTFSKGNDGVFRKLLDHFEKCGIPEEAYVSQIYSSVAHVGRANEEIAADTNPPVPVTNYGKCVGINRFSIEPSGEVAPCCGFNRFNKGLFMGSLYENTVGEIIDFTNRSIVFQYLKHKALHEVHEILSQKFDLESGYRHKCEACEALFGKEEHIAYLEEVAKDALGDLLRPDSLARGTYFFRKQAEPKPGPVVADLPPAPDVPSVVEGSGVADKVKRVEELEAENALLRRALVDLTAEQPVSA